MQKIGIGRPNGAMLWGSIAIENKIGELYFVCVHLCHFLLLGWFTYYTGLVYSIVHKAGDLYAVVMRSEPANSKFR